MSMQEELRRCNYLGDVESIYAVAKLAIVDHETDIVSVTNMCMLNTNINAKPKMCILFFRELGLITLQDDLIISNSIGIGLMSGCVSDFVRKTSELTLNYLLDNEYVALDAISIDTKSSRCMIRKSAFPLSVAVLRNYLIDTGMIVDYSSTLYELQDEYEEFFEENVRLRKGVMTLEALKEKQRLQAEQGRKAEEYVVSFEKRRLCGHILIDRIKQISDFDVTAGYDVLSFESIGSTTNDRFIEVKSYHDTPHFFWSSNEYEKAKIKGHQYYLYLIDMDQYLNEEYVPIIIQNPVATLTKDENWIVETASYEITKV